MGHNTQLKFLTNYDLGFDKENRMIIRFPADKDGIDDCALAKNEILNRNDVLGATRTSSVLGSRGGFMRFYTTPEREKTDRIYSSDFVVDYDFLLSYGIDLIEGRGFSRNYPEDINHAILINEKMKERLELVDPIGHKIYTDSSTYEIIGVVENFEGRALTYGWSPTSVIILNPDRCSVLNLKLKSEDINASISAINTTWKQIFGDRELNYTFLDDNMRSEYKEIDSITSFFFALSIISLIVASMGIFGLVLYTIKSKTRETAIRKVLGASITGIFKIFTKEFFILIAVSNLIACPLAYIMLNGYITQYPKQVSLGIGTYISGGVLTILIALVTSGYHLIRAARANPVDSLRYE
jgi:ABC-type antimicrobial peptide transport system permease subunit